MNVYDSDGLSALLGAHGAHRVETPDEADVLLVNTCSVREHAEERTLNRLSVFTQRKRERPDLVVGATGCMVQRMGGEIRRRLPQLDFAVGARALPAVLDAVERATRGAPGPFLTNRPLEHTLPAPAAPVRQGAGLKGFVTIIRGCNKRCAYCIVPVTRGPEVSRLPGEIVAEVEALVARGVVEVLLLGQNVNAYAAEGLDFADLLHRVGSVPGLRRLRFTTSHPRDMSPALVRRLAGAPRLMPWLHLPVQSGSPRVVAEMHREYTLEHYRSVVAAARDAIPDLALTTDVIVGFPGETAEDFEATVALLEEIRYDALYGFKYSPRSGTPAAARPDDVDAEEKQRRLSRLLQLQRGISHAVNQRLVGRVVEVLVEGREPRRGAWLTRTGQNKTLLLAPEAAVGVGDFVAVRVERAEGQSLHGRPEGRTEWVG
jgi:tRNA-2-methylthio-N6-dimethylallyladenosine synthase